MAAAQLAPEPWEFLREIAELQPPTRRVGDDSPPAGSKKLVLQWSKIHNTENGCWKPKGAGADACRVFRLASARISAHE